MDHLMKLHQLCCEELQHLQNNITNYLESSHKTFNLICQHEEAIKDNSAVALLAYDKFLTSMCNMLDLARKFNVHLCINDHDEHTTRTLFQAMDINDRYSANVQAIEGGCEGAAAAAAAVMENMNGSAASCAAQSLSDSAASTSTIITAAEVYDYKNISILPAEESSEDSSHNQSSAELNESQLSAAYHRKELATYHVGSVINASVTYVEDLESLRFYICDVDSAEIKKIVDLKNMINLRQYTGLPVENEVFGLVLDDVILRAVRESWMNFIPKKDEQHAVYLLDFGEVVHMAATDIAYHLPADIREIPAQAMLCELTGISGRSHVKLRELQQCLQKLEYEKALFCVATAKASFLQVNLLPLDATQSDNNAATTTESLPSPSKKKNTNPFITDVTLTIDECDEAIPLHALPRKSQTASSDATTRLPNGLTQGEMDMLQEEPLNTSNAMIATMGYNPTDERRLCRFYDPKTGACFKGANCRQEHTPLQPEGWTKDRLPAATIIDNHQPTVRYTPGLVINITPTHIGHVDLFYAQINDASTLSAPLIWNEDEVPQWLRLTKAPLLYEVVRARYEDDMWYRAKVIDCDEERKIFKVFYVDYGNQQCVPLNQLAHCDRGTLHLPFQAVLCRVADIIADPATTPEQCANGIGTLNALILNRSFDVKVVNHQEDLLVRFMGEHFNKIPKRLTAMGCTKPFKKQSS